MTALDTVEWEACLLEPVRNPQVEWRLRRDLGVVPPGMRYFFDCPWLTRAAALLGSETLPLRYASVELAQLIALVVSQDNSCRYCYAATRSVMRILGFSEARIRRLEETHLSGDLSASDRAALEFARCVSRAAPLASGADSQPLLAAGCQPEAVKEIAFLAASNVFFNRMSTLPALPPDQMEFDRLWYVRLLRPLLAHFLRPPTASEPASLEPEQRRGPFAPLVNALDGLPGAARLRTVIDEAWEPSALSRRTKALVFAVVARGVGCARCEQETRGLLLAEGLPAADVDHALAHLSGPGLDPIDGAAAALARESIWYRPAQIQRHLQSIRALLTREQLVDLIGIVALANMISRLGVAVDIAAPPR